MPHSYARSGNPLSLASFSTVWLRLSHRMPRQTPSDDSLANRNSAGRSFCSTILLSFSGRSYVAFRRRLFLLIRMRIEHYLSVSVKFLLSNCYVIAMSCDLLLCPCYVIALRMLCFCFALIIYCKLQARYRPYTFEDKMRTFFSSVYGRVPKGKFPL